MFFFAKFLDKPIHRLLIKCLALPTPGINLIFLGSLLKPKSKKNLSRFLSYFLRKMFFFLTNNYSWINFITVNTHTKSFAWVLSFAYTGHKSCLFGLNIEGPLKIDTSGTISQSWIRISQWHVYSLSIQRLKWHQCSQRLEATTSFLWATFTVCWTELITNNDRPTSTAYCPRKTFHL